jgi:hypothetical protein
MSYERARGAILSVDGVEESTMMKTPCLRYRDTFLAMMFDKQDALIIKISPERVNELISTGKGMEFNFTNKRFREWVLIGLEFQDQYPAYVNEALDYAKRNDKQ